VALPHTSTPPSFCSKAAATYPVTRHSRATESGIDAGKSIAPRPSSHKLAKSSLYPEGVKWYKANILIKKGKKDDAKPLLRDLINTNSIFKDRAVKQYEELYK